MGFKTISLSDAVYRRLRAERQSGESFSDVIDRLLEAKQPPLMKYAGAWKPLSKAELAEIPLVTSDERFLRVPADFGLDVRGY